jgi:hypothetical protein
MVKVDLRTITLNIPPQEVITKDNVTIKVKAVVWFQVVDPRVAVTALEEGAWHKQVSLMGEVVSLEPDPDLRDIDRLAMRYTGSPFQNRARRRWSAWVRIDRWYGWYGDTSWPEQGA